jgi:hypothetical protein
LAEIEFELIFPKLSEIRAMSRLSMMMFVKRAQRIKISQAETGWAPSSNLSVSVSPIESLKA